MGAELNSSGPNLPVLSGSGRPRDSLDRLVRSWTRALCRAAGVSLPDRMLAVDAWMSWELEFSLEFAHQCQVFDVAWLEEPLPLDQESEYQALVRESPIPIAGGEHIFTARNFSTIIEI